MPYKQGNRLGAERASKLSHIDVVNSKLVNDLLEEFEKPQPEDDKGISISLCEIPDNEKSFSHVFSVDGSIQHIDSTKNGILRQLSFVKTALFRLDNKRLAALDPVAPHPLALKKLMEEAALFHATVFPLRNIRLKGKSIYNSVREIIYQSLRDPKFEEGEFSIYETLKWLSYQKWDGLEKNSPSFQCPHCELEVQGLPYNKDKDICLYCGEEVLLTDMLGFHLEMGEESAPGSVASAYMMIHETLFLFAGIRYFWETGQKDLFEKCLFLKDGPLNLRSQYVKLIDPIRNFFEFAYNEGVKIYVCGQEKTGVFVDHLELIKHQFKPNTYFLPDNEYIRNHIQQRRAEEKYGYRTNYGNKIFARINDQHNLVIMIPTGMYKESKSSDDFIGFDRILGTLNNLLSYRHENALTPIEMAHGVASLSTYPSAQIFRLFSGL